MSMLQTPTSSSRDAVAAAQKKKGIKSSLGRFFSKKDKVKGGKDSSMPDGSTSMMSMSGLSISDMDSTYDTMSISGGKIAGRQKKK